mgnify:CR=1 FL=1|tara:strand:- start:5828 stop:6379 length:552 start_codon:yes stop_codon:yes gene_type:complete
MKAVFIFMFFALSSLLFGQDNVCHGAVIPTNYSASDYFEVVDVNHRLDFSVSRKKRTHFIQTSNNLFRLEKGEVLYFNDSVIAEFEKGKWKLNMGQIISEQQTEDGWVYRLNEEVILTAYFSLDRVEDCYYLCFDAEEWNDASKVSAYVVAARFTKSVPMSRFTIAADVLLDIFVDVLYLLSI